MALNDRSQLIASPPLHDLTIAIEDSDGAVNGILGFCEKASSLIKEVVARCTGHNRGPTLNDSMALIGNRSRLRSWGSSALLHR